MSETDSSQTEAARRAAARKAKILARGSAGLAKLAQTARGDEAQTLYGGGDGKWDSFTRPQVKSKKRKTLSAFKG